MSVDKSVEDIKLKANEIYDLVENKADYNTVAIEPRVSYDVLGASRSFWKKHGAEDSSDKYREGFSAGSFNSTGSTGAELLKHLTFIINSVAVSHMRQYNKPVDKTLKDLMKMLTMTADLVVSHSIDTISANEGILEREDVVALLHGFINAQYEQVRNQYVE